MRISQDGSITMGGTLGVTGAATFSSSITANSFIKSSGTSSQFLKADGSVDANAYLPLTGGTLSGPIYNSWSNAYTSAPRNDGSVIRTYTLNLYNATGGTTDRVTHYYTYSQDECCASTPVTMYYGRFNGFYNQVNIIYDATIYYHNSNQFYYRAFSEVENKVTFSIKASTTVNSISGTKADLYLSGDAQIDRSLNIGTTLGVTGAATLSSTLGVASDSTLSGDLILRTSGGSRFQTAIRHYYESQSRYAGEIQFLPEGSSGSALSFITNPSGGGQTERLRITQAGNIGIGTASPSYTLDVNGTFNATSNSLIGGTLGVTGAATLSSTLGVTGAATLSSTLGVTGAATLSSTLGVTGLATLSGDLYNTGNEYFYDNTGNYGDQIKYRVINVYAQSGIQANGPNPDFRKQQLVINGVQVYEYSINNVMSLTILNAATLDVISTTHYSTYNNATNVNNLATAMNNMTISQIGI
jgi:hypothetical protein